MGPLASGPRQLLRWHQLLGIGPYTTDERMDPDDNGIYVIDSWKIVNRVGLCDSFTEQQEYDFDEMAQARSRQCSAANPGHLRFP